MFSRDRAWEENNLELRESRKKKQTIFRDALYNWRDVYN